MCVACLLVALGGGGWAGLAKVRRDRSPRVASPFRLRFRWGVWFFFSLLRARVQGLSGKYTPTCLPDCLASLHAKTSFERPCGIGGPLERLGHKELVLPLDLVNIYRI